MAPSICHLPNGQNLIVTPVFGGLSFKPNDLSNHRSAFPPGWTIVLNEEDVGDDDDEDTQEWDLDPTHKKHRDIHRYKKPTLLSDHLFISAISNPSNADFKPAGSPTRQIAMMLWASLWWYFHQPEPERRISTPASANTAEDGRPKGEWRININREGIFKGKNVLAKLERMGLITTEDSSVGTSLDERKAVGFRHMFVTRRAFWQISPAVFLFQLSPIVSSPFPSSSPMSSRTSSPRRDNRPESPGHEMSLAHSAMHHRDSLGESHARHVSPCRATTPVPSQFHSNSHLPTYYPPHPPQYTFTNGIRHPLRPKPVRQGETIYTRYVPSVGQYISFRVASVSPAAVSQSGPWSSTSNTQSMNSARSITMHQSISEAILPTLNNLELAMSDVELLHKWMNDPRVAYSWGENGPQSHQEDFLRKGLSSKHSFPVIGCWDGRPFGYFEIYWVKEDILGKYVGGACGEYDRGIHCLVGEQEFRGPGRVRVWLSALVHYCWLADLRTDTVLMEPRVDNAKLAEYCYSVGFYKEREIAFPHKQANLMKINRDAWEKPVL